MKNISQYFLPIFVLFALYSCHEPASTQSEQTPVVSVKTVSVRLGDIENTISLNGKTVYLKKNTIVSPIAGYIVTMNIKFGDKVQKNDVLFEIQTRENKALENTSTFNGSTGLIKVLASSDGTVGALDINGTGSYVMEGASLCSIVENQDVMVQVNVPFEYNSLLNIGSKCKLFLPDNTTFEGTIYQILPVVSEADQTQNVLIDPNKNRQLPENLNLLIQFINEQHNRSCLVPKQAVMTNETQSEFWVMKIVDDSMAIQIPVVKGIENDSLVEILQPVLSVHDRVIIEGAYGLPDTSVVKIVK